MGYDVKVVSFERYCWDTIYATVTESFAECEHVHHLVADYDCEAVSE